MVDGPFGWDCKIVSMKRESRIPSWICWLSDYVYHEG